MRRQLLVLAILLSTLFALMVISISNFLWFNLFFSATDEIVFIICPQTCHTLRTLLRQYHSDRLSYCRSPTLCCQHTATIEYHMRVGYFCQYRYQTILSQAVVKFLVHKRVLPSHAFFLSTCFAKSSHVFCQVLPYVKSRAFSNHGFCRVKCFVASDVSSGHVFCYNPSLPDPARTPRPVSSSLTDRHVCVGSMHPTRVLRAQRLPGRAAGWRAGDCRTRYENSGACK